MLRRFPVVEKRWRAACRSVNESSDDDHVKYAVFSSLPSDSELSAAFSERKRRLGNFLVCLYESHLSLT